MDTVIPTGFHALDALPEGGFKRGELMCFMSGFTPRPAYGASGLGMQAIQKHVEDGGSILFINYEGTPGR